MKVNPILAEWIALTTELVEALEEAHAVHDEFGCGHCETKQLIDRARRRLEKVKR